VAGRASAAAASPCARSAAAASSRATSQKRARLRSMRGRSAGVKQIGDESGGDARCRAGGRVALASNTVASPRLAGVIFRRPQSRSCHPEHGSLPKASGRQCLR
jgi:hypothetical protein